MSDLSDKMLKMVANVVYILAKIGLKIKNLLLRFIYPLIIDFNLVKPLLLELFPIDHFRRDVKTNS